MSESASNEDIGQMWDRRYQEHGWSHLPDANLVELVAPLRAGRALDLGCGTGRNALWLARRGWSVTGVDASRVGLDMAREAATLEELILQTCRFDLLVYVPETKFYDLVVVANIHLDPNQRDQFFERAAAAVTPGGHLFIVGHHVDDFGKSGPPVLDRLYDESMFQNRFKGFTIGRVERLETNSDAGDGPEVSVLVWAQRDAEDVTP